MFHTTFRRAKEARACPSSYRKMANALGGVSHFGLDTSLPLDKVLEVCGLDDALWALQIIIEPADRKIRLFACDCAERVLPLFEKMYPDDNRPRQVIEIARKFIKGEATHEELAAARAAARRAWVVARATARATRVAGAAEDAWAAARDAAWAAWAAGDAAEDIGAAGDAWPAGDAERKWQTERFLKLLNC